ncbi:MAG: hypothetical protein RLZZ214_4246 [Verrucomicrobiota bacterium]|jgi:hypothetical protein
MNPNPDSQAPPPAKPKQSFWQKLGAGSLSISLILHLVLLSGGVIWVFQVIPEAKKNIDFATSSRGGGPTSELRENKQRAQMRQPHLSRITAREATGGLTLPAPEEPGQMASLGDLGGGSLSKGPGGPGSGKDFGNNPWGDGVMVPGGGTGPLFRMIPQDMRKRCSKEDRLARLKENGGTPACEEAVVKSLRWLKANQNTDGSWGGANRAAMTGFALLAYFGHCETPASAEFGDSCMRGIVYLINIGMKNEGRIASSFTTNHWSYEHAIATYALGEAATFCKEGKIEVPSLIEITGNAGQFIIDHQNQNGGWAYLYATEGGHTDVSVAGWQLQALKACSHTGIKYKGMTSCINKGLAYLNGCQNETGGFGYTGKNPGEAGYFTLTGVGMLCNQMWEKGNRAEVRKGAKYVLENTRFDYNSEFCDLYGHYYESQAMMQRGGAEWKQYNDLFRDQLLDNQDADGSWKTPGGGKKPRAVAASWQTDKIYRTCLCTLMLEVYYRFLNSGGGAGQRPGI